MFSTPTGRWITGAAIFVMAIAVYLSISSNGFCLATARFLSDAESIDAAIDQVLAETSHTIRTVQDGRVEFKSVKVVPYSTRDSFRQANPNCCKIVPHNIGDTGPYISATQRILGYAAKVVALTYKVNFADQQGRQALELVTTQYAITSCGRAWNATH